MGKGSFPKKARFRRLKKVKKNRDGKVVKKWSKPGIVLCTLPDADNMGLYTYGISKCCKTDVIKLCEGKGIAYDRAKDALTLDVIELDNVLPRRGRVKQEDLQKVKHLFNRERFDTDNWRDNPSDWEMRRWG